jgi:hypothetical protein
MVLDRHFFGGRVLDGNPWLARWRDDTLAALDTRLQHL